MANTRYQTILSFLRDIEAYIDDSRLSLPRASVDRILLPYTLPSQWPTDLHHPELTLYYEVVTTPGRGFDPMTDRLTFPAVTFRSLVYARAPYEGLIENDLADDLNRIRANLISIGRLFGDELRARYMAVVKEYMDDDNNSNQIPLNQMQTIADHYIEEFEFEITPPPTLDPYDPVKFEGWVKNILEQMARIQDQAIQFLKTKYKENPVLDKEGNPVQLQVPSQHQSAYIRRLLEEKSEEKQIAENKIENRSLISSSNQPAQAGTNWARTGLIIAGTFALLAGIAVATVFGGPLAGLLVAKMGWSAAVTIGASYAIVGVAATVLATAIGEFGMRKIDQIFPAQNPRIAPAPIYPSSAPQIAQLITATPDVTSDHTNKGNTPPPSIAVPISHSPSSLSATPSNGGIFATSGRSSNNSDAKRKASSPAPQKGNRKTDQ